MPSTRLAARADTSAAAARREPELRRLVLGDLDWIAMKALEKDRNRRYETANGLAKDLRRYLADEPVSARPPSAREPSTGTNAVSSASASSKYPAGNSAPPGPAGVRPACSIRP